MNYDKQQRAEDKAYARNLRRRNESRFSGNRFTAAHGSRYHSDPWHEDTQRRSIEAQDRAEQDFIREESAELDDIATILPTAQDTRGYRIRSAQEIQAGDVRGFWQRCRYSSWVPVGHDQQAIERTAYPELFRKRRDNRGRRTQGRRVAPPVLERLFALIVSPVGMEAAMAAMSRPGKPSPEDARARVLVALAVQAFREMGYSPTAISNALGISRSAISGLSKPERIPVLSLEAFARVFPEASQASRSDGSSSGVSPDTEATPLREQRAASPAFSTFTVKCEDGLTRPRSQCRQSA